MDHHGWITMGTPWMGHQGDMIGLRWVTRGLVRMRELARSDSVDAPRARLEQSQSPAAPHQGLGRHVRGAPSAGGGRRRRRQKTIAQGVRLHRDRTRQPRCKLHHLHQPCLRGRRLSRDVRLPEQRYTTARHKLFRTDQEDQQDGRRFADFAPKFFLGGEKFFLGGARPGLSPPDLQGTDASEQRGEVLASDASEQSGALSRKRPREADA